MYIMFHIHEVSITDRFMLAACMMCCVRTSFHVVPLSAAATAAVDVSTSPLTAAPSIASSYFLLVFILL